MDGPSWHDRRRDALSGPPTSPPPPPGALHGPDVEVDGVAIDSRARARRRAVRADRRRARRARLHRRRGRGRRRATLAQRRLDMPDGVARDRRRRHRGRAARRRPARPPAPRHARRRHHRLGRQDLGQGPRAPPPWRRGWPHGRQRAVSFNNELGVPLTLANAPDGTEAAVVEMGARGAGHVALLCDVARPTVGVVTAVVARPHRDVRHDRGGGGGEGRARRGAPRGRHRRAQRRRPPGGGHGGAHRGPGARATRRPARPAPTSSPRTSASTTSSEPAFVLRSPFGSAPRSRLAVRGEHQVANALAAAGAALACGVALDDVAAGLGDAVLSPWRMDLRRAPIGRASC